MKLIQTEPDLFWHLVRTHFRLYEAKAEVLGIRADEVSLLIQVLSLSSSVAGQLLVQSACYSSTPSENL